MRLLRGQGTDEGIDKYVTYFKTLASTCNFGDTKDSLIHDRIVCGTCDFHLRERLLREDNLTDKCMPICRSVLSISSCHVITVKQFKVMQLRKYMQ